MGKKTIGGFISALRKANGMTQKDLAERLNVSDKSVSRWENDEGAPDLSLIPVIAEIFGVTCDELLRGERKSPEQRAEPMAESEPSPKAEKQLQRMLKSAMAQYKNRTYIAMGISVGGLLAALICNLVFLRASLGFLLGAVFFAASIVCQIVFLNRAMFSVDEEEFQNLPELNGFKRNAVRLTEMSVGLTMLFIGFTFPLVLIDAYLGLGADSMLLFGLIGMAAFLVLYAVVLWFVNARLIRDGVYVLGEKEEVVYRYNHKLKKKVALITAAVLSFTFIIHVVISEIWGAYEIMEHMDGAVFEDYDSFGEYMAQDIGYGLGYADTHPEPVDMPEDYEDIRTITDANGNVLYEYNHRNYSVIRIRHDGGLPIIVYNEAHLRGAENIVLLRDAGFVVLYLLEAAAGLLIYRKKRQK